MSYSTENFDSGVAEVRAFAGRSLDGLTVTEFADLRVAVSRTKRSFDAVVAAVAGEAARRSTPDLGRDGLASKEGHRSPEGLIANDLGLSPGEAKRLVNVGSAMNQADERERREAEGGEPSGGEPEQPDVPQVPTHPHVTAAVRAGELSIDQAAIITRTLDAIAAHDPEVADSTELERRPDARRRAHHARPARARLR